MLEDGSRHEILKNFPSPGEVRDVLASAGIGEFDVVELGYHWCARYVLPRALGRSAQG